MLRPLLAALAALALTAPDASAAPPWTDPAPVPGAPDAFPTLAFPEQSGPGTVAWNTVTDDPAGQISGSTITVDGAQPARTLADGMTLTASGMSRDGRLIIAGRVLRSNVPRAAVATGTSTGALGAPRLLPTGGASSSVRAMAVDEEGATALVTSACARRGCPTESLWLMVRSRGTFRRVARLTRPGTRIRAAAVAVNYRGDAVAAWENDGQIYARLRTTGGRLGRVERLGAGTQASISVAMGFLAQTVVAWGSQRVAEGEALGPFVAWAAYKHRASRPFHAARELGRATGVGTGRYVAAPGVRTAIVGSGVTAAFTMTAKDGRYAVGVRDVGPGRRLGATQQVSPAGTDAILADMTTGGIGEHVVLFITGRAGSDPAPGARTGLGAAVRPRNSLRFRAPETIATGTGLVDHVRARVGAGQRTFVTWRLAGEPIQLASREPIFDG